MDVCTHTVSCSLSSGLYSNCSTITHAADDDILAYLDLRGGSLSCVFSYVKGQLCMCMFVSQTCCCPSHLILNMILRAALRSASSFTIKTRVSSAFNSRSIPARLQPRPPSRHTLQLQAVARRSSSNSTNGTNTSASASRGTSETAADRASGTKLQREDQHAREQSEVMPSTSSSDYSLLLAKVSCCCQQPSGLDLHGCTSYAILGLDRLPAA